MTMVTTLWNFTGDLDNEDHYIGFLFLVFLLCSLLNVSPIIQIFHLPWTFRGFPWKIFRGNFMEFNVGKNIKTQWRVETPCGILGGITMEHARWVSVEFSYLFCPR